MIPGLVYVMLNVDFPHMVKIGRTGRTAEERARELRSTGVPRDFIVLIDRYVRDSVAVEKALHDRFAEHRVDGRREFFRLTPKEAIDALLVEAEPYLVESPFSRVRREILPALYERVGSLLHNDLRSVALMHTDDSVVIVSCRQVGFGGRVTTQVDLTFIVGEGDEPMFSIARPIDENVNLFFELDEFSLAVCTPLIRGEEADRIFAEANRARAFPPS